jgi:glutamine cyclotransferase
VPSKNSKRDNDQSSARDAVLDLLVLTWRERQIFTFPDAATKFWLIALGGDIMLESSVDIWPLEGWGLAYDYTRNSLLTTNGSEYLTRMNHDNRNIIECNSVT